ncbi:Vps62-related protein [Pseudomonas sp. C2B4]|uniref:Vps62-related protein n=1 Tax=Pseudomonas sp. C2B4 TaxID=2735270 RepID=UPI001586EFAD|nr:Vps62-related protein [Pseudomonas sp. C2B4]NUU34715.1 Vps62-related protein [Pseudomonas sp. C2B4]
MTTNENGALPNRQIEPIKLDNLLISFTTEFNRILDTRFLRSNTAGFWRPTPAPDALPGYFPLGDLAVAGDANINGTRVAAVVCESDSPSTMGNALSRPDDFERVWTDAGSGAATDSSIWRPLAPAGYVAMGLVCSNSHEKPSINAIRCVRADLVIASTVGNLIWSDLGSRARQNFSAWEIEPPTAASGEIYFAPGTFFGVQSHNKPAEPIVYALRMQIRLEVTPAPEPPVLSGYEAPLAIEARKVTQTVKLPWFAVKEDMRPADQLRSSPFYRLERTDQYALVGHGHNTSDKARAVKWTALPRQDMSKVQIFNRLTSIDIFTTWPAKSPGDVQALNFSANLDKTFIHTETSTDGWRNTQPQVVIAMAAKNKAVAVYQLQSSYKLLREDNTPVAISFEYTDDESLHMTEYPSEECATVPIHVMPQPTEDLPTPTDTAP